MTIEQVLVAILLVALVLLSMRPLALAAGVIVGLIRWWRSPERRQRRARQKALDAMARVGRPRGRR